MDRCVRIIETSLTCLRVLVVGSWLLMTSTLVIHGVGDSWGERLDHVRHLLREYRVETVSQVHPTSPGVLSILGDLQPREELVFLLETRDSAVLRLHGVFFAEVCRKTGKSSCVAPLIGALRDADPEWRAFACEALGSLSDESAVPHLLERLRDHEAITSAHGRPSVSVVAAIALLDLGRCEGVGELLALAHREEYWDRMFLTRLQQFTGERFGADIDRWSEWFSSHRPECLQPTSDSQQP